MVGEEDYKDTNVWFVARLFLLCEDLTSSGLNRHIKNYTVHKQTYKELSEKYKKSHKTLRKHFDEFAAVTGELKLINGPVALILDATFFGR